MNVAGGVEGEPAEELSGVAVVVEPDTVSPTGHPLRSAETRFRGGAAAIAAVER